MPFREPYNRYYREIISPAIEKAGMKPLRADKIYQPNIITSDIWKAINMSDLVIAEMTGRNPNVLYELGLSHALGKPVIMITSNPEDIPFNVRHIRFIHYKTEEPNWGHKLKKRLTKTMISIIKGKDEVFTFPKLSLEDSIDKYVHAKFGGILYKLNEVSISVDVKKKRYHLEIHKIIKNMIGEPITRVLYHFICNVLPHDPEASFKYYQKHPVIWKDLNFRAWDKSGDLDFELIEDFNSRKDFFILFSTRGIQRPIYAGEEREFWYSYDVSMKHWGPYVDRPIIYPTEKCIINLIVPRGTKIFVSGVQLSPFREHAVPLKPKKIVKEKLDRVVYRWEGKNIVLGNTYQMNWTPLVEYGFQTKSTKIATVDHQLNRQT